MDILPMCAQKTADNKIVPAPGYHYVDGKCVRCPIGTFGTDGASCDQCPFATWAPNTGQSSCSASFTYSTVGQQLSYMPFGVNKINVTMWGGGGGGDKSADPTSSRAGGGGGYLSCIVTVPMSQNVYVIVAGGGGANSAIQNTGGR